MMTKMFSLHMPSKKTTKNTLSFKRINLLYNVHVV